MSNCKWCGEAFIPKRANNEYCSATCRQKYANVFRREKSADADFWAVSTPYGSHGFDPIVANWMHKLTIPGSTVCGV